MNGKFMDNVTPGTARLLILLSAISAAVAMTLSGNVSGTEALALISAIVGGVLTHAGAAKGAESVLTATGNNTPPGEAPPAPNE